MSLPTQTTLFDLHDPIAFPRAQSITQAIEKLAELGNLDERGAIYTKPEVVEFILDIIGYTIDKPLFRMSIMEPSFGAGDFLQAIIRRLLISWKRSSGEIKDLYQSIRAVEIHRSTFNKTKEQVFSQLIKAGIPDFEAIQLIESWLIQGDFLLEKYDIIAFDFIVGNPPYVRQELISRPLLFEYRRLFSTLYDRADLYIPFIENSLNLLTKNGKLGFICTDRWMKNRYGGPLRTFISNGFHLSVYIDMVGTEAFLTQVNTYPAITIIQRGKGDKTRVTCKPIITESALSNLSNEIISERIYEHSAIKEISGVVNGAEPWILESSHQKDMIKRIEKEFPKLEEVGCKVGIGVATGLDKVFIGKFEELPIENDRKMPLVSTTDISSGKVDWKGFAVMNPYTNDGHLVNLENYPLLKSYLETHKDAILQRHCAKKTPSHWYRTIDKINPKLKSEKKLLIPDIKGEAHIVYEDGKLYPHHNLYYVTSEFWDLRALQAVLLSSVTKLFISTYSTQMRGGYLRFQAQYLRRIRLPLWESVPSSIRQELINASQSLDIDACNHAVYQLYKLNHEERLALGGNGK